MAKPPGACARTDGERSGWTVWAVSIVARAHLKHEEWSEGMLEQQCAKRMRWYRKVVGAILVDDRLQSLAPEAPGALDVMA